MDAAFKIIIIMQVVTMAMSIISLAMVVALIQESNPDKDERPGHR